MVFISEINKHNMYARSENVDIAKNISIFSTKQLNFNPSFDMCAQNLDVMIIVT